MRGSFSRALAAVSLLVRLGSRDSITFSEFLEELEVLGLKGRTFGPECYRAALEAYLGTRIEVIVVDDLGDPDAHRAFAEEGNTAVLWYCPDRDLARILVLSSLSPLEMSASVYHELSHLAAGHLRRKAREHGRSTRARLARKAPPVGARAGEVEAKIREEYCLLAGALGAACLADDELRQVG